MRVNEAADARGDTDDRLYWATVSVPDPVPVEAIGSPAGVAASWNEPSDETAVQ